MIESVIIAVAETSTVVKTSGFPWDKVIPVICVVIGAVLGFFLNFFYDLVKEYRATIKEKKDFLEIKKEMPEIIKVVKKGLKGSPLAYELLYQQETLKSTAKECQFGTNYAINFGYEEEPFPSRDIYLEQIKNLKHIGLADFQKNTEIELSINFLNQIKKWG